MSAAEQSTEPIRRPYVRREERPAPFSFWVDTPQGSVEHFGRYLELHEYHGLTSALVGELEIERDAGKRLLRERVLKLKQVVTSVEHDEWAKSGRDPEKFYNLPGNANLAWLAWDAYEGALLGAYRAEATKSGTEAALDPPGEGELAASAGSAADA
jgi:hypothetical protein